MSTMITNTAPKMNTAGNRATGAELKLFVKKCSLNLQNHTHLSKSVRLICKILIICQKVFT